MHRRFEFVGGSSAKFWEVRVAQAAVTVHYGRLGTQGQSLKKSFPNPEKALQYAEKQIGAKTGKGYVERPA